MVGAGVEGSVFFFFFFGKLSVSIWDYGARVFMGSPDRGQGSWSHFYSVPRGLWLISPDVSVKSVAILPLATVVVNDKTVYTTSAHCSLRIRDRSWIMTIMHLYSCRYKFMCFLHSGLMAEARDPSNVRRSNPRTKIAGDRTWVCFSVLR